VIMCSEGIAHDDGKDSESAVPGGRAFDYAAGDEESTASIAICGDSFN